MWAAVTGSISPRLLRPSVSSTITFDAASEPWSRLIAVASPMPIAVPSSMMPTSSSSSNVVTTP